MFLLLCLLARFIPSLNLNRVSVSDLYYGRVMKLLIFRERENIWWESYPCAPGKVNQVVKLEPLLRSWRGITAKRTWLNRRIDFIWSTEIALRVLTMAIKPFREELMAATEPYVRNQLYSIPLTDLLPDPDQPRRFIDPASLEEQYKSWPGA
jgi:hypothetical protein